MNGKNMKKPTVISLFAGCGGSSLGYKWAGYKELLAIDFDKLKIKVFANNFPETQIMNIDIRTITGEDILKKCSIMIEELDVLDGSPPCQGFSISGKRQVNDPRNDMVIEYIRLLREIKPKVFLMENVSGMIKGTMKGLFKKYMVELKESGYNVKCQLMDSAYFEVPQHRQRLIFIGIRNDLKVKPSFPKPINKLISVRKALEDLDISKDEIKYYSNKKDMYLISKLKQGQHMSSIHPKGWRFNLIRLSMDKPSNTIIKTFRESQTGLIHPLKDRFLTISELKRLCSFPDNFIFNCKFEDAWKCIGDAVMPKFMYYIAKHIKENILERIQSG